MRLCRVVFCVISCGGSIVSSFVCVEVASSLHDLRILIDKVAHGHCDMCLFCCSGRFVAVKGEN